MLDDTPFANGRIVLWQQLHRSTRLRIYKHLINRRIAYRTYFMRDNNQPPATMYVVDVIESRSRGAGHDRIFVGTDEKEALIEVPWARIVEIWCEA